MMHDSKMSGFWPSSKTIKRIENQKCHVVAVGGPDKKIPNFSLKWRISYTLWERELVWSFKETQFFCFVYLKHLNKTKLRRNQNNEGNEEENRKDVSSFHLKNLLFWVSAECSRDFLWKKIDFSTPACFLNVKELVKKCLDRLQVYVEKKKLPHFIDRERNLFESSFKDEEARQTLLNQLQNAAGLFDNFDEYIKNFMSTKTSNIPDRYFRSTKAVDERKACEMISTFRPGFYVLMLRNRIFEELNRKDFEENISLIEQMVAIPKMTVMHDLSGTIREETQNFCDKMFKALDKLDADRQTSEIIKRLIRLRFGLAMASFRLHWDKKCIEKRQNFDTNQITDKYVLSLLTNHTDALSGLLYLCTYFLRDHRVPQAESKIDDFLKSGPMLLFYCGICSEVTGINIEMGQATHIEYTESLLPVPDQEFCFVHDVLVTKEDIHFFIPAIQIQVYLEFCFFINPLVYLYYLKVICEVSAERIADNTLRKLRETVFNHVQDGNKFRHLNLLGHAYYLAKQRKNACECYFASIHKQKRNNSAFYLLLISIYELWREDVTLEKGKIPVYKKQDLRTVI